MTVTTGEQRAALLLRSLPADVAESVLARLVPPQADRLRARLRDLDRQPAPPDDLRQALREFNDRLRIAPRQLGTTQTAEPPSAPDVYVPSRDARSFVDPPGQQGPAAEPPAKTEPETEEDPLTLLQGLDVPLLAAALQGERMATLVPVLASLPVAKAGEVLRQLPPEVRRDATLRLGQRATVNPDLQRTLARAVLRKSRELASNPEGLGGDARVNKLAELLRNLDREDRAQVLETLTQTDPETAEKVKAILYVFEDLLRIEGRSLQALLAEIDMKTLAVALRSAEEGIKTRVTDNLSMRARETLTEEMSLLGTVNAKQVREAQGQIVQAMQRLDQEGKLAMQEG